MKVAHSKVEERHRPRLEALAKAPEINAGVMMANII